MRQTGTRNRVDTCLNSPAGAFAHALQLQGCPAVTSTASENPANGVKERRYDDKSERRPCRVRSLACHDNRLALMTQPDLIRIPITRSDNGLPSWRFD